MCNTTATHIHTASLSHTHTHGTHLGRMGNAMMALIMNKMTLWTSVDFVASIDTMGGWGRNTHKYGCVEALWKWRYSGVLRGFWKINYFLRNVTLDLMETMAANTLKYLKPSCNEIFGCCAIFRSPGIFEKFLKVFVCFFISHEAICKLWNSCKSPSTVGSINIWINAIASRTTAATAWP